MHLSLNNIHQESIGSCTSIDFTAAAGPGADGAQVFHWSAQEGVIFRHSPAPLPIFRLSRRKCSKAVGSELPIVAVFVADTLAAMLDDDR
jgi:hypothetical protein